MSDFKKAQLAFAQLEAEVNQDGMFMTDGPNHSHTITGGIGGTEFLNATHGANGAFNGRDVFDFSISAHHDFHLTINGFNPELFGNGGGFTSASQAIADPHHDVFEVTFDPSTGITTDAQANQAFVRGPDGAFGEHVGHDVVYTVHTATVNGTITFAGAGDLLDAHPGEHFQIFAQASHVG